MRFAIVAVLMAGVAIAQPEIAGVYQPISDRTTLPGGLKISGSPAAVPLLPAALQQAKSTNLKQDPWKMCQPVGPFRMLAKPQTKFELVQVKDMVVMLFEDLSHGLVRTIYLRRGHPQKFELTWEGDTRVVDTVGFNDRTWLNEEGAQHSDALHLVERIRPILAEKYLEYKMTAEDPKTLARPYTYTRYHEKLSTEIVDDVREDEQ
jgi:hypothetical protein